MWETQDTIFALSSGAGVAAVAVVRISGPATAAILRDLTGRDLPPPRRLVVRTLRDPASRRIIDQAMVAWLPGPRSFTGEDMAELQVHGSRAVVDFLLDVLAGREGARAAEPGEFTRRAMWHGKLDLVQVEGLADLLRAETRAQHQIALRGLSGESSGTVQGWRRELTELLALLEAAIDFVDEEDVAGRALESVPRRASALVEQMRHVLRDAMPAERIREGVRVVIAGAPNVGKSSLLNWLAGREVAIVSDMPGTTRDVLEVRLDLDGVPVTVFDTAGLRRRTQDGIERIGMDRARDVLAQADMVLWLHAPDVNEAPEQSVALPDDVAVLHVLNKADLLDSIPQRNEKLRRYDIVMSVKQETGLAELLERLRAFVRERFGQAESALFSRVRQRQKIAAALEDLQQFVSGQVLPVEIQAELARSALRHLDELMGRVDVEELLDHIFAEFCIGK